MRIVSEFVLRECRKLPCFYCGAVERIQAHHVFSKGAGRLDSSIGLACLTELFTADLEDQPDRGGRDDTDSGPHEPPEHTNHVPTGPPPVVQQWRDWLAKDPSLAQLNGAVPTLLRHRNSPDESLRVIWTDVTAFAKKCGRGFNERANTFDSLTDGL